MQARYYDSVQVQMVAPGYLVSEGHLHQFSNIFGQMVYPLFVQGAMKVQPFYKKIDCQYVENPLLSFNEVNH